MRAELVTARSLAILPTGMVRLWLAHAPDITEETRVLEQLVAEVLAAWEGMTDGYLLGTQTWRIWYDSDEVETDLSLPFGPLQSVTSITSYDTDDVSSTVASTEYQVVAGDYGSIGLTSDGSWPTDLRSRDALAVLAIFGVTGAKVPYIAADTSSGALTLDDAYASGLYVGTGQALYEIDVTTAGATDIFRWRRITKDAYGNRTLGAWTSNVSMTGSAQALGADGFSVAFAATTGHAATDAWTIEAREAVPDDILLALKGLTQFYYRTKGSGIIETVSGQLIGLPFHVQAQVDRFRREPINRWPLDALTGVE